MSPQDLIKLAAGNLRRMKLRTFLTVSGVIVAIGAFVAMLSFGAGNRRLVMEQWNELGLFATLQVFPGEKGGSDGRDGHRGRGANGKEGKPDSSAVLDDAAVADLAKLPGVRLAYPFDSFRVTADFGDTTFATHAQALPPAALATQRFSKFLAGGAWSGDGEGEVLVTSQMQEKLGLESPDSLVGRSLVVRITVASLDSAVARLVAGETRSPGQIFSTVRLDSLRNKDYQRRLLAREMEPALSRFIAGFMAGSPVSDTLRIAGVVEAGERGRARVEPILLPVATAARFGAAGISNDPAALLAAVQGGRLPFAGPSTGSKSYPKVTLELAPGASHAALSDSIEARGFIAFSFAEEFEQIRRAFFYFDLMLGAIGLVALVIAALGIVNTMVMSVSERRREIGILKSLGADLPEIRALFLVESGLIGVLGAGLGIVLGWTVSRVASIAAKIIMERQGIDKVELFATPPWLILTAFLFGTAVSLLAGSLPAARAAKVDPVAALRND